MQLVVVGILSQIRSSGEKEYLLVSATKDFGKYTGAYYPPGGHVEQGEDEAGALSREIHEELGLTVEPVKRIATTSSDIPDQTTSWWECRIISGEISLRTSEISDARFFTPQEMQSILLWPATKKFFDTYIA